MRPFLFTFSTLLLMTCDARISTAQSLRTEHVYQLDDTSGNPEAGIDEMAWLEGFWSGEGFGGTLEETWNRPTGGTMVGLFKLSNDGAPTMYEIQLIVEEEGSLVWKVKHFDADFRAWEEKDEYVSFPLVKIDERGAFFDGLSVLRQGPDSLRVYITTAQDGVIGEQALTMTRVR